MSLKLNGVNVKTLEELQKNFDLEKVVEHFKSGKLLDWLTCKNYDAVAVIKNISAADENYIQKICGALGVEFDDEEIKFFRYVQKKKLILSELTRDKKIIANAEAVALNQNDLKILVKRYSTIYLCGDSFNISITNQRKKYIGILKTSKIKIPSTIRKDFFIYKAEKFL